MKLRYGNWHVGDVVGGLAEQLAIEAEREARLAKREAKVEREMHEALAEFERVAADTQHKLQMAEVMVMECAA